MKTLLSVYSLVFGIALSVYIGIYSDVEGLNNIGLTALWIMGVLWLIAGIAYDAKKSNKKKEDIGRYHKYILRIVGALSIIGIIYGGHIVIGIVYLLATAIQITHNKKDIK